MVIASLIVWTSLCESFSSFERTSSYYVRDGHSNAPEGFAGTGYRPVLQLLQYQAQLECLSVMLKAERARNHFRGEQAC